MAARPSPNPNLDPFAKECERMRPSTHFNRASFCRAQPGCFGGQDTRLRRVLERLVKVLAQKREFLLIHQFLHALEKLAFLFANVDGHTLSECRYVRRRDGPRFCLRKALAQHEVIEQQLRKKRIQFRESSRCREQNVFFRREMNSDFPLKKLRDFRLPCGKIALPYWRSSIDTNA